MRENQKTISEWGTKTFGYPKSPQAIIDRMIKECKELEEIRIANNFGTPYSYEKVADECADIYIVMCQVMHTLGYSLESCIDHKMQINRGRKWKIAGDGTGQHE